VTTANSLSDAIAEAHRAFQGGDLREHYVPRSAALIAQFLTLIDPADRGELVTTDYAKSHVVFLLKDHGSEATRNYTKQLQAMVDAADFGKYGVTAELTGNGVVAYQELDHSVVELVFGFVLAFIVIMLTQWLTFRSVRVAALSAIPNLLPVVACFATMTLFGIKLRGDNALVLCVSIGGLFNTTIQFAVRVRQRAKEYDEEPDAVVLHALRAVGPAAWFTAITLSAGFSVLLFSTFPGLRNLGLLSMVTFLIGVLADTIITPALFRVWYPWQKHAARTEQHVAPVLETDATAS
jgi:predicted RND superfamily exporter protein